MKTWQNLPNTSTPINADNLNRMMPYVATAIKEGNSTLTSGDQITMTSIIANGGGFILQDGGIKVNRSDIKKVLISGQIWFNNPSGIYEAWVGIKKKEENYYIASSIGRYDAYGYYVIDIAPRIIGVSQGDILELKIRSSINTNLQDVDMKINDGGGITYMTIQEVE